MPTLSNSLAASLRNVRRSARNGASHVLHDRATRYKLQLGGTTTIFSVEDPVAHGWFYPRYSFGRIHERAMTLALADDLRRTRGFADVGANLGFFTCLAARLMPGGDVDAFEMDVDNFALLQTNIALNPSDVRVMPNNRAVTATGEVTVSYPRRPGHNHPALSLYNPWPDEGSVPVEVEAIRLDKYFGARGRVPEVVKVDVEGAELDVLRGFEGLLQQVHRLYVELHPPNLELAGQSVAEVLALLSEWFDLELLRNLRGDRNQHWEPITADTPVTDNVVARATRRG